MNASELTEVLRLHALWRKGDPAGKRANGAKVAAAFGVVPGLYILKLQDPKTCLHAWKYLENGVSPYQHSTYAVGKSYEAKDYSADERILCASGLNVATLDWCLADSRDKTHVEFLEVQFKASDIVAVPLATDGKFRVRKFKVLRKVSREQAHAILDKHLALLLQPEKEAA